jgi:hypothetical protein
MLFAFAFCNLKICFLHAQSTTISPINEITPSLVASSPATLAITTVAQEIPTSFAPSASKLKLKSEELLLAGEALKLLIAPSEKAVEFTISLSSKILSQSSTLDLKGAKRFLLALENDHFNVDVIGIPFVNDTGASLAFGNSIEVLGLSYILGRCIDGRILSNMMDCRIFLGIRKMGLCSLTLTQFRTMFGYPLGQKKMVLHFSSLSPGSG